MRGKRLLQLIMAAAVLPLAAGGRGEESREILQIPGSEGTALVLEKPAQRVVSLGPNITETVFALGKGDALVGRTDFCDYPPEVSEIPSVGTLTEPSLESILLLKPDLVIGSTHMQQETADKLNQVGIPVLYLNSEDSFEGVYALIESIAMALGAEESGKALTDEMKATVGKVKEDVKNLSRPRVYYVIGYGEYGDYTAGGDTFIGQLITMAGGVNVAFGLEGWRYSLEELIKQNPDLLICSRYWHQKEGFMEAAGYRELDAVKAGRIYTIDNNMLDRQGPRLAEGLAELARIIHSNEIP
ncbi:MAG: ABC transporter substrate-binding protein [Spirochaetales bacterium]|nr:ABC transporter substrate-binding protein [Spirochaetales bacterium]